jgi:hypothetical protein
MLLWESFDEPRTPWDHRVIDNVRELLYHQVDRNAGTYCSLPWDSRTFLRNNRKEDSQNRFARVNKPNETNDGSRTNHQCGLLNTVGTYRLNLRIMTMI